MDPATIATITGLAGAAKTTVEAVRLILEKAKGRDAEKAAKEALGLVTELNARLLSLQEVAFRLHQEKAQAVEENAQLRAQIRQKEEGTAKRQQYQRKKVGNATVMVHPDDLDTLLCPVCLETKGKEIPLQTESGPFVAFGAYYCPGCKEFFG